MRSPPSSPREPLTPLHLDMRPDIVLSTDHTPGAWIMSPPSSRSTLAPILQMKRLRLQDRGTRGPAVLPLQMHHAVSEAPTEPASHWPLKGSGAGGGGAGLFIPAIEGASGRQERADGAPSRPPAHRPPPRPPIPLGAELGWSVASWPGGEHPAGAGPRRSSQARTWVSAGPEGPHPGLRLPRVPSGPGAHTLPWGSHTGALGAGPGQCREQEAAPQHLETSAPRPCGARGDSLLLCRDTGP